MHLYLSAHHPWNTNFCTAEGQVIYKAESLNFRGRAITIKRIIPPDAINLRTDSQVEEALRDSFSDLAEIQYNTLSASRIQYNGTELDTTEFFTRSGLLGRNRSFTAPDGKEYEWHLRKLRCKLCLKGDSKSLVAIFHRGTLGLLGARSPASLEIFPQGQHMVDLIVITFIFVERLRHERGDR